MFDFTPLFEFSRSHCVEICAFLVPANLLATLRTLFLTGFRRPASQVWLSTSIAYFFCRINGAARHDLVDCWRGDGSDVYFAGAGQCVSSHQSSGQSLGVRAWRGCSSQSINFALE